MTDHDIKNGAKYAMKNRKEMEESALCGCYYCLTVIPTQDIEEWTDYGETALCPKCGCDCLIPSSYGLPLDETNLKEFHTYWFGK